MAEFNLAISKLYTSLLGVDEVYAKHYRNMAAALVAFQAHLDEVRLSRIAN